MTPPARALVLAIAAGAVVLAAASRDAAADDDLRLATKLEAGSELDTNASRESSPDESLVHDPAAVGRMGARLALTWRPAARQSVRVSALAAAKKYGGLADSAASSEDVAVFSGDARYERGFSSRPLAAGLRAAYYEAVERDTLGTCSDPDCTPPSLDHDFRTGDGAATLALRGAHDQTATLTAGWRFFRYKPNATYDFDGEHVGVTYRKGYQPSDPGPTYEILAEYAAHHRVFAGDAYTNVCPPGVDLAASCLASAGVARVDLVHVAALELGYAGDRFVSLRYELSVDDSNSFGQSLVRHRLELQGTSELPFAQLIVTARGILQLNQFLDPVLLARDIGVLTIEEENRNALVIHVARDFGDSLTIESKFSFYSNEFATQELRFRRATAYLGVVYTWDSARP